MDRWMDEWTTTATATPILFRLLSTAAYAEALRSLSPVSSLSLRPGGH